MTTLVKNHVFGFETTQQVESVRQLFAKHRFNHPTILKRIEPLSYPEHRSVIAEKLGDAPLDVLIRLFMLQLECQVDDVAAIFEPMHLEEWQDAGVLEVHGDTVKAMVVLYPLYGLIVAIDNYFDGLEREDHVTGFSGTARILANITMRDPVDRLLDVGTGCGIHALFASKHAKEIVATDLNERAIAFAKFNAALNGVTNIDFRVGNLFEPVAGETFDQIVCNPPFVISPQSEYLFRDNGMDGDQFLQTILQGVTEHLNEGGIGQVIGDWVHLKDQSWKERLAQWFEGTDCDSWVIRHQTKTPEAYSKFWCSDKVDVDLNGQEFQNWLSYFSQKNIEAISLGFFTLRKCTSGQNWFRIYDHSEPITGSVGDDIKRRFEGQHYLSQKPVDLELLQAVLMLSPGAKLTKQSKVNNDRWELENVTLRLTQGLAYTCNIDQNIANLLLYFDGKHTVQDAFNAYSLENNIQNQESLQGNLQTIRSFIHFGILIPVVS